MPSLEQQPAGLELSKKEKLERLENGLSSSERAGLIERWRDVSNNAEAKEALAALARLGINVGFTIADMVPGAGEVMEPALNTYKTASKFIPSLRKFDPTKDIGITESIAVQALSSPTELASLGTAPTYLINTLRQTWADYKAGNFSKAKDVVGYLITGNKDYFTKLKENSSNLETAAGLFKK